MEEQQLVARVETILAKLLIADNAIIQQGTAELREVLNHPQALEAICHIATRSVETGTRQHATVVLRRLLGKKKKWTKLQQSSKDNIKKMLIEGLMNEKDRAGFTALSFLVALIARYELPTQSWPDLLLLVNSQISSNEPSQRQAGFLTLSSISDMATEEMMPHFNQLLPYLSTALSENSPCAFYAIETMSHFIPFVGTDHVQGVQSIMPQMLKAAKYLVSEDEDKAIEALDVFDVLMESEVSIIAPYIRHVLELCLEVARDQDLGDGLRSKALSTIQYAVRLKKKIIVKQKLVDPILEVVFMLICQPQDDDDEGSDDDDIEETSPRSGASQTLDSMAMNLPPDKVITPAMKFISTKIGSEQVPDRRGALLALAVICEGAADHVMTRYLETLLQWVCPAIRDPNQAVRNEALFALGQMSEHLQPNITKYHGELLPVLFDLLTCVHQELKKGSPMPPGTKRVFYALEMFCEKLEEKLTPYLPPLVQTLLSLLQDDVSLEVQALAMSALEATAIACKEDLTPFFEQILGHLQKYLQVQNEPETEEENNLLLQSLGTLATLARTMNESFKPIANEVLILAITLVESRDDADLRKCCYSVFAAVSTVMKSEMESYLNRIVPPMLTALRRFEDNTIKLDISKDISGVDLLGDLSDSDGSEDLEELESGDEDDEEDEITVYNAALEEKEEACDALKEIATSLGSQFMPFLEDCSKDIFPLIGDLYEDIRKSAVEAAVAFTIMVHKNCPDKGEVVRDSIMSLVPRLIEIVQTDPEPVVVMAALDGIAELLKEIGALTLCNKEHLEKIVECATMVLKGKSKCQLDVEEDADGDSEDEGPEQEAMLFEYAGEVVPSLVKAAPPEVILPVVINTFVPLIIKKAKKSNSEAERSFSAGCLAEIVREMKETVCTFSDTFFQAFMVGMGDKNEEVRSNSAYGIGLLAYNTKANFDVMLKVLSDALSKETAPRVIDNICAAVARMLLADSSSVPVDKVSPVLVSHLPLKEDLEENEVVYQCLSKMFDERHPFLLSLMPQIVHSTAQTLSNKKLDEESRVAIRETLLKINSLHPTEFSQSLNFMPPELKAGLQNLVS